MPTRNIKEFLISGEVPDIKKGGTSADDSLQDLGEVKVITDALDNRLTAVEGKHSLLLHGDSIATSQQPTGVDTPIQVEFGVAQGTPSDPVMIDALGNITFNVAGKYMPIFEFHYGRSGSTGTSIMFMRVLKNGSAIGVPRAAKIDSADTLVPFSFQGLLEVQAGDVIAVQILRDSAGDNSGGLFKLTPSLPTWTHAAPSAAVSIFSV